MTYKTFRMYRVLGKGGFGEASLALRNGKTIVLKKIGCASVNDANQALLEASCLQRLSHPGEHTESPYLPISP